MPARHEEIHRQFGADAFRARRVDDFLAHGAELVAHAAVVVVVGDLRLAGAALDAAGAELAQLMDPLPADESLAQRFGELGLVVDLDLLLQVDDDQVGEARAFVVELALGDEPDRRLHADHVRAGREPGAEQDRLGCVARGHRDIAAADRLLGAVHGRGREPELPGHSRREALAVFLRRRVHLERAQGGTDRNQRLHLCGSLLAGAEDAD